MRLRSALLYHYRSVYILLILLSSGCVSYAQLSLSTSDIIAGTLDNQSLMFSENLKFLDEKGGGIPIVESMEIRTETDEFVFDQQEYLIRFDLNSRDERKAYDKVLATNQLIYKYKQEEYIGERVEGVYRKLIDYYFYERELDIVKEKLIILRDRKMILNKLLAQSDNVSIENWLSNQDDIISAMSDSVQLDQSIRILDSMLFDRSNGGRSEINFDDIISISTIKNVMDTYMLSGQASVSLKIASAEESMAKAEYELEEAETNKWLQWVQVRYQSDNDVVFQNELAFSTSINLPNKSTNKAKKNEAALDVLDSKYKKILQSEKFERELISVKLKLESAIIQYENLKSMVASQSLDQTYQNYISIGNVSPLVLLEIKGNMNRYEGKLVEERKDIYEAYLDLLKLSSLLVSSPRVNFISDKLIEVE